MASPPGAAAQRAASASTPAASPAMPPQITQVPGETYCFRDLLKAWGLEGCIDFTKMSPSWRCQLVPFADDNSQAATHAAAMKPFFAPASCAEKASEACGGDGLAFVTDARWNAFPRPKIAFLGGWGAPGSNMADADYLRMVKSFSDVVASSERLNLQMFHRQGPDQPGLPILPELLEWPLPQLLGDVSEGKGGPAVVCDNATRISKRGALTWWHLDDGGEFVFQVALPLRSGASASMAKDKERGEKSTHNETEGGGGGGGGGGGQGGAKSKPSPPSTPHLLGPSGKPVVKLFVFAPLDSYDLILQDRPGSSVGRSAKSKKNGSTETTTQQAKDEEEKEEEEEVGTVSGLHLFETPTAYLPGGGINGKDGDCGASCGQGNGDEDEMKKKEKKAEEVAAVSDSGNSFSNSSPSPPPPPVLPTLMIAALEAGGRPLLSMPNLPHLVVTVQDCVMIEQRRVSPLFLDEVHYWLERVRRWEDPPVMYPLLAEDIRQPGTMDRSVIVPLLAAARKGGADTWVRARARASLACALANRKFFALSPASVETISKVLQDEKVGEKVGGEGTTTTKYNGSGSIAAAAEAAKAIATRADTLRRGVASVRQTIPGVTRLADGTSFSAYVHRKGRPHWGPVRTNVVHARTDRSVLETALREGKLTDLLEGLEAGDDSAFVAAAATCTFSTTTTTTISETPSRAAIMDDLFD